MILLACGRNREPWEQPFRACAIDEDLIKPDGQNSVISFICDNIPIKAILFFFGCLEVNST